MGNNKKIAVIYEQQKAFSTVNGEYFGYDEKEDGIKCHRMTGEERKLLLLSLQVKSPIGEELVHWAPAAREFELKKEVEMVVSAQRER